MGGGECLVTGRSLGCLLASLLAVQALCFTFTYLHFSHKLKQIEDMFSKNSMSCLTADTLNPPPDSMEVEGLYSEQARMGEDQCWRFREQIQQLIRETIAKRHELNMSLIAKGELPRFLSYLRQSGSGTQPPVQKVAAHLIGNHKMKTVSLEGTSSRNLHGQKIQVWEPKRGQAFLHNVEYTNGELIVPQTGLYYVYGQTYFRHQDVSSEKGSSPGEMLSNSRNKQMAQYIYKTTAYPDPILLMKHTRTTCWARNAEYGLHSIYQGGIFELRYQDRIFVAVSNISLIDVAGGSSFFGAFLIG